MKYKLAVLIGFLLGAFFSTTAFAHTATSPSPILTGSCDTVGATTWKHGEEFRCVHPHGSPCNVWAWVYNPDTPKSGKTAWPHRSCPCSSASATPTPSHTPSTSPSPSNSATAASSPTPAASATPSRSVVVVGGGGTGSLPVTGPPVLALVGVGLLAVVIGGTLVLVAHLRRRTAGDAP